MNTLEFLNSEFHIIRGWDGKYRRKLMKYIDKCLKFCGREAEVSVRFKTYGDAEKAGADFLGQFPSCVQVKDKEGGTGYTPSTSPGCIKKTGSFWLTAFLHRRQVVVGVVWLMMRPTLMKSWQNFFIRPLIRMPTDLYIVCKLHSGEAFLLL